MTTYDYQLIKAIVEEAISKKNDDVGKKLDEVIFHLKEIKELLYKGTVRS